MYEVYAIIASLLLPTGLIGFVYFLYYMKTSSHRSLWTFIFDNIATVLLGTFYLYSAVILSQTYVSNEVSWFENNIDDLAIVNDTMLDEVAEPFNPLEPEDHNNEIEDTRNSKNKGTSSDFLRAYQSLVLTSIKKTLRNETREERSLYRKIWNYARDLKDQTATDILENQDCFLKMFLYHALLVYSFITSALSVINTCQMCNQSTKLDGSSDEESKHALKSQQTVVQTTKTSTECQNVSETFGEKITDDASDNSSQNAAPVGPLFDADSISGSSTNLEVFSVKKLSQANLTSQSGSANCGKTVESLRLENPFVTAGKCVTILTLPVVLVLILYAVMKSTAVISQTDRENFDLNSLPNFNETKANVQTDNFFKEVNHHDADQLEINLILSSVYKAINKFQEDHKYARIPVVTGLYLSKLKTLNSTNTTNACIGNEPNLKTFNFTIFVLAFFAVLYYMKTSEIKLTETKSKDKIKKCFWAFLMMWSPEIIDTIFSTILSNREPNVISALLLLLGNMDRLYSTKRNIDFYKMYGKANTFVNPISK